MRLCAVPARAQREDAAAVAGAVVGEDLFDGDAVVGEESSGLASRTRRRWRLVRRRGSRCRRDGCRRRRQSARSGSRPACLACAPWWPRPCARQPPPAGIRPSFLTSTCTSSPGRSVLDAADHSARWAGPSTQAVQSETARAPDARSRRARRAMAPMRAGPSLRSTQRLDRRSSAPWRRSGNDCGRLERSTRPGSAFVAPPRPTTCTRSAGRCPSPPRHGRPGVPAGSASIIVRRPSGVSRALPCTEPPEGERGCLTAPHLPRGLISSGDPDVNNVRGHYS